MIINCKEVAKIRKEWGGKLRYDPAKQEIAVSGDYVDWLEEKLFEARSRVAELEETERYLRTDRNRNRAEVAEATPPDTIDEPLCTAPPRPSGTITATLSYAGKGKPLPYEMDPRDEALEAAGKGGGECPVTDAF